MSTPQLLSDRYELAETLGYGGMSEVHRGHDVRLGREVAVKILRADLARDPQFQERFRREAQNAAALNHPAIVAVYDTGETETDFGPLPYIVMEYVDGRTLRDIVKGDGPVEGKRAMEIMADVSAALDFSHRHGIVHRDVKPANVMIAKGGAVKVMDFGIARALADGQAAMTQTAAVIGTAQYLSPEQARGEAVDARSDVYSAGCVLYELLTGQPPFTGDSPVAVAYQHVREDPNPPSSVYHEVTPELDAIVLKALAKNPANRYQTAAEMRSDLVKVLSGKAPDAPMVLTDADRTSIIAGEGATTAMAAGQTEFFDDARPYDDEYDDYDEAAELERQRRRRKAWKRVGIVALCLIVLAGAAWLTTYLLGGDDGNKVAVPNLVGQKQEAAVRQLSEKNMQYTLSDVFCEAQPNGAPGPCGPDQIGSVVNTDPAAGAKIDPISTKIKVGIGRAPREEQVPQVKGASPDQARQKLNGTGFQVADQTQEREVDDDSLAGKVVATDPKAGSDLTRGSKVTLIIGKPTEKVSLSDFTGQQYDLAASNLRNMGLNPSRQDLDSDQPEGTVIGQSPRSGQVPKGTTVTLKVSKGNQFTMPDLTGQTQSEAQSTLAGKQWQGSFNVVGKPVTDQNQDGKIQQSNPSAGAKASTSDTITIVVGKYQAGGQPTTTPTPPDGGGGGGGGGGFPFGG
nr:Stk1 family PASTA domain-containing Ser/Thr kinase [Sciscionella marina]